MGVNFFQRDDRDLKFVLFEHMELDKLLSYDKFSDFSSDDFSMIIEEALKVGRDVLGPALQDGDREGCEYEDGVVKVPKVFHECYKVLIENGWNAATANPEFGGQGLPHAVGGLISEILCGANVSMMGYGGLAVGNGHLIENYGTEEDKALFVEKMYSGVWGGTMCLTEPDAGSDVGWIRTKAVPDPDSDDPRMYKIEGTKRFITCGKHDLTENIIHLVLARIEGSPAGTKGISLFIVPEIWVNDDGLMGEPNDVYCTGVEHKMGTHGLSTCSLSFGEKGGCRGILLGEPNSGMAKMFQMMNEARIGCSNQSLALAASAYDTARIYAKERVQGPPFADRKAERVPIIQHEDVRRMLMNMKSGVEAMRAMIAKTYFLNDVADHDPDEEAAQAAQQQLDLYTPLLKGYFPDLCYNLIRDAIQVLGGVGFCAEFPVEQYARDVKIQSIWEGTCYIQSLDLVGRKLAMDGGKSFQSWTKTILTVCEQGKSDPDFNSDYERLEQAVGIVGEFAAKYMTYFMEGKTSLVPLSSTRFLDSMAETVLAELLLEQGRIARDKLASTSEGSAAHTFYRGKIETARFFCRNILPNVFSRQAVLNNEDTSALDIPEDAF